MYEDFHILLDQPSQTLSLEFDDYADALAEIVLNSRPRFAVGIFGDWGSGKTTLMEGISARLAGEEQVVRVFFNAWRYEREPHLLVPMLDTLRESLLEWADGTPDGADQRALATRVAATASRAARAVLAGITLRAALPLGGLEASLDASRSVEAWRSESEAATRVIAGEPKSFYHASFRALREAMGEFVKGGASRIVFFVDDLDRCLPENALQVLESMKLFFDLEGFVFVVGLDQQVIEQAVELRYQAGIRSYGADSDQVGRADQQGTGEAARSGMDRTVAAPAATYRSLLNGANYVKKIFQVQFSVPRVVEQQLKGYVEFIAEDAKLPPPQRDNLRDVVSRHLPYLAGEGSVNPREVKRLINAYTLQLKMLERKLPSKAPNPNVVLALQIMLFRSDWEPIYQVLAPEPAEFIEELRKVLDGDQTELYLGTSPLVIPASLLAYTRGQDLGQALLEEGLDLNPYVSSIEATSTVNPIIIKAIRALRTFRRSLEANGEATIKPGMFSTELSGLRDYVTKVGTDDPYAVDAFNRIENLEKVLDSAAQEGADPRQRIEREIVALEADLRELKRRATAAARATA